MKFGIGQPVKRVEDKNLFAGKTIILMTSSRVRRGRLPGRMPYGPCPADHDLNDKAADGVLLAAGQADLDADNIGEIECQHFVTNQDGSEVPRVSSRQ